jgi:hypothetical protein
VRGQPDRRVYPLAGARRNWGGFVGCDHPAGVLAKLRFEPASFAVSVDVAVDVAVAERRRRGRIGYGDGDGPDHGRLAEGDA